MNLKIKRICNLLLVIAIVISARVFGLSNVNADDEWIYLQADIISNDAIMLTWDSDRISEDDVEYKVYYKPSSSESFEFDTTNDKEWTIGNVEKGVEYTFYVETLYEGETLRSNYATIEISPYAAQISVVNSDLGSAMLSFDYENPDGNIKEFKLYRTRANEGEDADEEIILIDTISADIVSQTTIEYLVDNLLQNRQYKFYIETVLENGEIAKSNSVALMTYGINLNVSNTDGVVDLFWDYNDETGIAEQYKIYVGREDDGEVQYELIKTIDDPYETYWSVTEGLEKNTDYWFYVEAVLENGDTIKSKAIKSTIEEVATEVGLEVDSKTLSGSEVYLFWEYDKDYYEDVKNFEIYKQGDYDEDWIFVGETNENAFLVKNLSKRTGYIFLVVGTDKYGQSVEGMSGQFKTPSFGLTGTMLESNKVKLTWDYDGSDGPVNEYRIYREPDGDYEDEGWLLIATTENTSYVMDNLQENKKYIFNIKAELNNGDIIQSNFYLILNDNNTEISGLTDMIYSGNAQNQKLSIIYGNNINGDSQNSRFSSFKAIANKDDSTFELEENDDYTVSYNNNTNVGTATVTIKGTGVFGGEISKTFKINPKNIATDVSVSGIVNKTYNGKIQTQNIVMKYNKNTLVEGRDYSLYYNNNKNSGTATITIVGTGNYIGRLTKTFKINRASQPLSFKYYTKSVKYTKVKSKAQVVQPIYITKKQGVVTYKKLSGSTKLTINKTTGKVTVKKGTKKGTYKIRVKVYAAGNANYKSGYKTVTITVKVK